MEKVTDRLTIQDIKKFLGIYNWETIDIFGNLNALDIAIENKDHEANALRYLYNHLNYEQLENQYYQWWLVGKCGYFKILKEFLGHFVNIISNHKDLNIFTRIYLGFLHGYKRSNRIKFICDFYHYLWKKEKKDIELETLFNDNKIDRLYIYKSIRNPK